MKKLLIGLLALVSVSSFADILDYAENDQILDAVIESFKTNDLACVNSVNGLKYSASDLRLKKVFTTNNYNLEINRGNQPVITLTENSGEYKYSMKVTTDDEYKTVTMLDIYAAKKENRRVNLGTITEPNFQEVVSYKSLAEVICSSH